MALSTVFSLDKILKEFYAGPIRDQLNNEMLVFELFNRRKMNWVGRRVIMPVRVSRNNSGAFAPDNGALPPAGQQGYADLTIPSKYLYGRMSITGPAIAQAKASVGAFVNGLQQELDGAVETVKNAADLACFTGGGAVGFVNDRAAAASTMPFSGNLEGLPGSAAPGIPCVVVRNDTYAVIAAGAAGALFVRQSATAGSAQFVTNLGAGNNLDLTGLAKGAAATVVILALDAARPKTKLWVSTETSALVTLTPLSWLVLPRPTLVLTVPRQRVPRCFSPPFRVWKTPSHRLHPVLVLAPLWTLSGCRASWIPSRTKAVSLLTA